MQRYLVELIGTFFLIFTIVTSVIGGVLVAPLTIGAVLMVMIYAGGHISGGHYNPGVTLGVFLRGKLPSRDVVPYWMAQVLGAALAALVARHLAGPPRTAALDPAIGPALVAELLFSFALVWVVLNVATAKDTEGNSFYGLAIGFTVAAGAFAVGGISGGVFNSAVAVGISLAGLVKWSALWIYVLANLLGGALAAYVFMFTSSDDRIAEPVARGAN